MGVVEEDLGDIIVSLATKGGILHDVEGDDNKLLLTVSYPNPNKFYDQSDLFETYEMTREKFEEIWAEADILRNEIDEYVREETARREAAAREEAKRAAEKEAARAEKRKQYQAAAREKKKAEKEKQKNGKPKNKKTLDL